MFIRFKRGYMLPGIFTRFLVKIMKKCSELLQNKQPRMYCNYTLLSLQHADMEFDVYLIGQLAGIKIGVVPRGNVGHSGCVKFAFYLIQVMVDCIEGVKYDEGLFYQTTEEVFSMKCPVCFGEKVPCERHSSKTCHHDDCGHFWSLAELCELTKDPVCQFATVVQTHKFSLERVKPWIGLDQVTTPTFNQNAINDLDPLKRQRLCRKLDVLRYRGDFRELAGRFSMSTDDLDLISQKPEPTNEVLRWAANHSRNTLSRFREILVEMKRDDCVTIIDQHSL